jgi:hypothetical protein
MPSGVRLTTRSPKREECSPMVHPLFGIYWMISPAALRAAMTLWSSQYY